MHMVFCDHWSEPLLWALLGAAAVGMWMRVVQRVDRGYQQKESGGGMYLSKADYVTLTSCSFSGNRAQVCVCLVWHEHP